MPIQHVPFSEHETTLENLEIGNEVAFAITNEAEKKSIIAKAHNIAYTKRMKVFGHTLDGGRIQTILFTNLRGGIRKPAIKPKPLTGQQIPTLPAINLDTIMYSMRPAAPIKFIHDVTEDADLIEHIAFNEAKRRNATAIIDKQPDATVVTFRAAGGRPPSELRKTIEAMQLWDEHTIEETVTQSIRTTITKIAKETGRRFELRKQLLKRVS